MQIDFQNELGEKTAKLLISSLNNMVSQVIKNLDNYNMFDIVFDNEERFSINKNGIMYFDSLGYEADIISLNTALNINKYVLDIQNKIKNIDKNNSLIGCYTEQDLAKRIPIYGEHENIIHESVSYLSGVNIIYDRNEEIEEYDIER